jgi:transposase
VVVEFLRKECNVELQPRQSRNWLKRLGFVLKRPTYRYLEANNGVVRILSNEVISDRINV